MVAIECATDVNITEAPVRGGVGNPPGLTAPPACPGSAPGWDSPGPTLAPGGHSLPGVGQVTGQRCGCAADTYGQWTASTM
jgi:hypothetical protein